MSGNSISDHLAYFGVQMGSDAPGSCRIVMDPLLLVDSNRDLSGNIHLSRDPAAPFIKLSTEVGDQVKSIDR